MDDAVSLNQRSAILFPVEADAKQLGGKGAMLKALGSQFAIPAWFAVISPQGHEAELDLSALDSALHRLDGGHGPYAVRSSATEEDGVQHSFAGQFDSFLNVGAKDVADRIRDVWASARSTRIQTYRDRQGLTDGCLQPTVLVQVMIPAEWAGVAFSADPVSGRRGLRVVSATQGLGDSLVSGEVSGETFVFNRDGQRLSHAQPNGAPPCPEHIARAAARLATQSEHHFGRPQDIEWAWAEGQLWLLQSRAITTLADQPDPDGTPILWDNSNIAESYSGMTTPLTFSFARYVYAGVYRQFCRMMKVPESVITDQDAAFEQLLGLIRGRLYYNLLNWYRCLAMLPGFQFNRTFMEQMMGVGEALPEELLTQVAPAKAGFGARMRDLGRLLFSSGALVYRLNRLPRDIQRFNQRLEAALNAPSRPLEDMRADELVAHYRDLETRLLSRWDAPLTNDFFAMIFHGVLGKLCIGWAGERGADLHNALLVGESGIISVEPARRVAALADLARDDSALVILLQTGDRETIEADRVSHPNLDAGIRAYLADFGDRCIEELKLESRTLTEDPMPLYRAIGTKAATHNTHVGEAAADLRQSAESEMDLALEGHPWRKRLYRRVLKQARTRVRERENLRFERTRLFGRVRRIMLELGKRFYAQGRLGCPEDVFYLELDEILGFVEGRATTTDLDALVKVRRQVFDDYRSAPPPANRFITRGAVNLGHRFEAAEAGPDETESGSPANSEEWFGTACCSGRVRGRARVITDPRQSSLEPGDILIAERTDPGWILLLAAASAVVVQHGSLLSHAAIVSRELGLPSVVAVPGIMNQLKDGDWIEVDGGLGVVRRLEDVSDANH